MIDIIFWVAVGAFIGWNTPMPFWAKWFWNWITSLIKNEK